MTLEAEYEPSRWQWVRDQVDLYERTGGEEGNVLQGRADWPIVVITSRGATSGRLRKNPVMRVEHDGAYLAVGSKGGDPKDPAWVANFRADPKVELQDGPEPEEYVARELDGDERAVWWERAVAVYSPYASYQEKTDRLIPLFLLERA